MTELRRSHGFTLIELLVALAILSLSVGVLMGALSNGVLLAGNSARDLAADALAQSLLDRAGREFPLRNGDTEGEDGGMTWRLRVEPYGEPRDREAWPIQAKKVSVTVKWGGGGRQAVTLETLRVAPKDPQW